MASTDSTPAFTLTEWLDLPQAELAAFVRSRKLAVLFAIDGSQRHFMLRYPMVPGQGPDYSKYTEHSGQSYTKVLGLLFDLGIETVMTPMLYPPNFDRGEEYMQRASKEIEFLGNEPFSGMYARQHVKARLYGDYDVAPRAAFIRPVLERLAAHMAEITPSGEQWMLCGINAGSFVDEMILRTVELHSRLGRTPTADELRSACFPDAPQKLDLVITASWLRIGRILPPVLDDGSTDIYSLNHLAQDVQESTLRRILYDHLFRRTAAPEDHTAYLRRYTPADLETLSAYYEQHRDCVVGLGSLVGPGLWYGDHAHPGDPTA